MNQPASKNLNVVETSTEGNVYILTNPAMPGLVKIGKTSRTVEERLRELNSTGVPMPFEIAYSRKVEHMDSAARDMHEHFDLCRVSDGGEFFRLAIPSAVTRLETYEEALSEAVLEEQRIRIRELEKTSYGVKFNAALLIPKKFSRLMRIVTVFGLFVFLLSIFSI